MEKFAALLVAFSMIVIAMRITGADVENGVVVESVRKDNLITVICDRKLQAGPVKIYDDRREILCTFLVPVDGSGKRFLARVETKGVSIRAGMRLYVNAMRGTAVRLTPEKRPDEKRIYRKTIVSKTDGREMIFIDPGFFYAGSDSGEDDEKPRHVCYLDGFYVDTYEVTCGDYRVYVNASHGKYPRSWGGKDIEKSNYDLPVLVSYTEAERYAEWAGKILPTEEEWEKAASASSTQLPVYGKDGYSEVQKQTAFPWGDQYKPDASVCADFWGSAEGRVLLKKGDVPGPLPVHRKNPTGLSSYGLVDVAGNLPEWTSTWYQAYDGNTMKHFRFGKQVRVIKGGGWYSSRESLRVSARDYGGIPNLDEDSVAGFRCVKRTSAEDYE